MTGQVGGTGEERTGKGGLITRDSLSNTSLSSDIGTQLESAHVCYTHNQHTLR